MIRGVYSVRHGLLERGVFSNSVPAFFERIGRISEDEYAFFTLVRHCLSTGAYGDAETRITLFGEDRLIAALAERLGVDAGMLESNLNRSLTSSCSARIGSRVEGLLASRLAPNPSDLHALKACGLGYVEFDPSERIIPMDADVARYAAK
ncbi:MAG: hypothetical protein ACMXYM_01925 [Candidatus Woesearchaeota archaeon]